jgi:hypothetical protein
MTTATTIDTDQLMGLWATPPADDAATLTVIRSLYTDPVVVNGATFTATDLLTRVRSMQESYRDLRTRSSSASTPPAGWSSRSG